ncbi:MAG: hypothetical protein A4E72_01541 [Syntrophus sp. PtaU1.Bin208]|nr:MAG: hypothetical protein A4E72_01541 [Syntrophus sp. PtaU1.Bin208]
MFLKKHPKKFFTTEEQEHILGEIRRVEENTSGEIRVHLDRHAHEDTLEKARKIFLRLGMDRTRERNGVLIYIATDHRKFAILGDEGINRVVPENYWEDVKEILQSHFRRGEFEKGLCLGIRKIGEKLKVHFPVSPGDRNEIPDSVSEGN